MAEIKKSKKKKLRKPYQQYTDKLFNLLKKIVEQKNDFTNNSLIAINRTIVVLEKQMQDHAIGVQNVYAEFEKLQKKVKEDAYKIPLNEVDLRGKLSAIQHILDDY